MSEMIERVAKAICCPNGCLATLDCSIPNKRDMEKAKAAIEAMREPTEAMLDAGAYDLDMTLEQQLERMIEAALK